MAIKKTEKTSEKKWPAGISFFINEDRAKKLAEWKAAHNTIFGVCDEEEYDYVFNTDGSDETIIVRNTFHDTEIDLTDDASW